MGIGLRNKPCRGFCHLSFKKEAIRKREGPVTVTWVALGLAPPSKEDTDKDAAPPPLHLIVPVGLHKSSVSKGYYFYSALVNWGTTYNLISHSVAN